jgi:hypothetical protein
MNLFIPLLIIIFAIFVISISVQFARLLFGDAKSYFTDAKKLDNAAIHNELKKVAIFFGGVAVVFGLVVFVCIFAMVYQMSYSVWQNTLPPYVPEQTIYAEMTDYRDEVREMLESGKIRFGHAKFLSSNYVDMSFYDNQPRATKTYHEILDIEKGLRVAGFVDVVSRSRLNPGQNFKNLNSKTIILDDYPAFVINRDETRFFESNNLFSNGDVRRDHDYWLAASNQPPIEIEREMSPGYFSDSFDENYLIQSDEGLNHISLSKTGPIKNTVWKNGDGFNLLGKSRGDYMISQIANDVFFMKIKLDPYGYFLYSNESGNQVRRFELRDILKLAPEECQIPIENNDLYKNYRFEVYSSDGKGKIVFPFYLYAVYEMDLNQLEKGSLEDVFQCLGPRDKDFYPRAALHGNKQLIFQKRSNPDIPLKERAKKVWQADSYFICERNEDGTFGEMQPLDWSVLKDIKKGLLSVMFPPKLEDKVVIQDENSFWTMNLDGTGLKQVFPKVSGLE